MPGALLARRLEIAESVPSAYRAVRDWLEGLPADLTRGGTILVPAERVAHAMRRLFCREEARSGLLAGIHLLPPVALAREVLSRAGHPASPGGGVLRHLRLLDLFQASALELQYFRAEQLRAGGGYVDAFARAIGDLEDSALTPQDLMRAAAALERTDSLAARRVRDVAWVWERADAPGGAVMTEGQTLRAATAMLQNRPEVADGFAPLLALLVSEPSAALLGFLHAVPSAKVIFVEALPHRAGTQRWRTGPLAPLENWTREAAPEGTGSLPKNSFATLRQAQGERKELEDAGPEPLMLSVSKHERRVFQQPVKGQDERQLSLSLPAGNDLNELRLLRRYLFAPPEVLADPSRARSPRADGSVCLEEYPSIEDEVDAAVAWVVQKVREGVPLEEIALVVPEIDPYARLLEDRLSRVGRWSEVKRDAAIAVYVAGGRVLTDTPAGVRLLALLRAWRRALNAEAVVPILPFLRPRGTDGPHLSPSRATELVYGAGIIGGTPGDPEGAKEWVPRLERRRTVLEAIVAEHETSPIDEPEKRRHRWTPQKAEKWLADLTPLIPAVRALQSIAETVLAGAALKEIWPAVRKFVEDGYALPPSPPNLLAVLAERLESILADPIAERLRGLAAIDVLIAALGRERITEGRFGEPRVFIGTAKAAAGLTFKALRVLGAAEGALPRTPHDDPIVPNGLRSAIETLLRKQGDDTVIPRIEDRVLEDLHAFHRIVRSTKDYLSLSAPRQWLDRSEREVSGVLLEIDAALGRSRDGGEETSIGSRLRTAYFRDAQARCEAFVRDALPAPRHAMAHLPRQGAGSVKVPWQWVGDGPTAVDRTMDLLVAASQNLLCAGDGRIELALLQHRLPGLRNEQPVSATALVDLLRCPHQFLLQRVLFMTEPASRPSTDTIDASAYGSLFHSAAEAFFREAGPMVCGREGQLSHWLARAGEIASTKFDELRDEYPLRGADAIERERRRLVRQIEQLVRYEWELGLRSFVGAERSFGVEEPVVLQTGDGALHVRGAIDRVDRKAKQLSVRDLKTGRIRDFGEEPINPIRDLQIGLYTLVVEADPDLDARVTHAAYVHPSEALEMEREFAGSALQELRQHTQQWLRIARGLLRTGLFVRTPNEEDCRFCPFVPACGEGAQLRSAAKLSGAETEPELEDFVTIKVKRAEDE